MKTLKQAALWLCFALFLCILGLVANMYWLHNETALVNFTLLGVFALTGLVLDLAIMLVVRVIFELVDDYKARTNGAGQ